MSFLAAILALAGALVLQVALGEWAPGVLRHLDVLSWPVAWYALVRSQRSAMLMGSAAGLLQDGWFQAGPFGIHGFSKTLLGGILGGLGARFDLNHFWGQMAAGALLFVGDRLIETGLLLALEQTVLPLDGTELALGAVANGLLVPAVFAIVDRGLGRQRSRRPVRRRA